MSAKRNMFYFRQLGKLFKIYCQKNVVDHKKQCWQKFKVEKLPHLLITENEEFCDNPAISQCG